MKFVALTYVLSCAAAVLAVPATSSTTVTSTATVSYDETYDASSGSLTTVACSDGSHGFIPKGYTTFGSLPGFPSIGGVPAITSWNSASCGTCWKLTYNGKSVNVLGVDAAEAGTFNIALAAMNKLTNNQAKHLGRVKVTYEQVSTSDCK